MIPIGCYNSKNLKREFMKKFNILIATSAVALLATGCVKPAQDTQGIYNDTATNGTTTAQTQGVIYEEAQSIVYEPAAGTTVYEGTQAGTTIYEGTQSGTTIYEGVQDSTVITTSGVIGEPVTGGITYPDPYANGGTGTVYNDPYASQQVITDYPAAATSSAPAVQGGGIHLQIAALKNYATAEDYKNRLSLAPGQSAYVQRAGNINKVIVTGIPSLAEANRLKESRFPGAFIVQGGSSSGYTPAVQPNYGSTAGGAYNVNNPYGVASSSGAVNTSSGIGVQVGAFGSMTKAQSVVNSQHGQYPAIVKKIGRYYKVILTGFPSRSAAKAHASTIGGFVVNY